MDSFPRAKAKSSPFTYYGDLSLRTIARRLDVSEGTVKRTLHDARAQLRRMVGQNQQLQPQRRQTMTGWHMAGSHPRQYEHALADETTYEGKRVAELRCLVPRADGFGTLMQTFSAEHFLEQRVRFNLVWNARRRSGEIGVIATRAGLGCASVAQPRHHIAEAATPLRVHGPFNVLAVTELARDDVEMDMEDVLLRLCSRAVDDLDV